MNNELPLYPCVYGKCHVQMKHYRNKIENGKVTKRAWICPLCLDVTIDITEY